MKIKHWAGYGCVEAKKIDDHKVRDTEGERVLSVQVTGNHECGLIREDTYDLERWLLKRFKRGPVKLDMYCYDYACEWAGIESVTYHLYYKEA